jgi:hypothetical protein
MEYTTRLPAAHLGGEALPALEEALLAGCTAPRLRVELDHGSVTYRCSSLAEIRNDATLPGVVQSFEVSLTSREGEAALVADGRDNEFRLRLAGDREWVESKRDAVETFFQSRGARLRTFLERYMAFCLGVVATALRLVLYYSGAGSVVGMGSPVDSVLFGSLALIGGGVLHLLLNVVYPYAALVTPNRGATTLVYLRP